MGSLDLILKICYTALVSENILRSMIGKDVLILKFIVIVPFEVALILFLFCILAPIAGIMLIIQYLPYIGFAAMLLLTIQIYIWALTEQA